MKKKDKAKFSEEDRQREEKPVVGRGKDSGGFQCPGQASCYLVVFPLWRLVTTLQPTHASFKMKRGESQPRGALTVRLEATGQGFGS